MTSAEKQLRNEFAWNNLHGASELALKELQILALGEIAAQLCRANDLKEHNINYEYDGDDFDEFEELDESSIKFLT